MASTGKQKKLATVNMAQAMITYSTLYEIIKEESELSVREFNERALHVSHSVWSNYMRTGRVSQYVVDRLVEFTGISEEYFTGALPFSKERQQEFARVIKKKTLGFALSDTSKIDKAIKILQQEIVFKDIPLLEEDINHCIYDLSLLVRNLEFKLEDLQSKQGDKENDGE